MWLKSLWHTLACAPGIQPHLEWNVRRRSTENEAYLSYFTVWSQILTVQSALQEMKTPEWKWFHLTASTAMLWAS